MRKILEYILSDSTIYERTPDITGHLKPFLPDL